MGNTIPSISKWFPPPANVLIFIFGSYDANPLNIFAMHKTWCHYKKNNNDSIPKMKFKKWQQVRLKTLKFTDLQPDVIWSRCSWKWTPSLSACFGSISALKSQNCTVLGLGKNKCLHLMASVGRWGWFTSGQCLWGIFLLFFSPPPVSICDIWLRFNASTIYSRGL